MEVNYLCVYFPYSYMAMVIVDNKSILGARD